MNEETFGEYISETLVTKIFEKGISENLHKNMETTNPNFSK